MNIVFVTNNKNKLLEIRSLISKKYNVKSLKDIDFHDEIDETEATLEGNALLKARHIYSKFGLNCFADDTGLEIEALNGAPGVYSARYAGPECIADDNIEKVLSELKMVKNRSAKFITVIALIINGEEFIFEGICKGNIALKRIGHQGFGYDPIFIPENKQKSFGQMSLNEKNLIAHRAKAVKKLIEYLTNLY